MNNIILHEKLGRILRDSEILMRELEEERDESLENLRFDGEEEILNLYYKKILTSIYRMRNNTAALLLRNSCSCIDKNETIGIFVEGVECKIPKQALKNILQKDYTTILDKNIKLETQDILNDNVLANDKQPKQKETSLGLNSTKQNEKIDSMTKNTEKIKLKENRKETAIPVAENPTEAVKKDPSFINDKKVEIDGNTDNKLVEDFFVDEPIFAIPKEPIDEISAKPMTEQDEQVSKTDTVDLDDLLMFDDSIFSFPEKADADITESKKVENKPPESDINNNSNLEDDFDFGFFDDITKKEEPKTQKEEPVIPKNTEDKEIEELFDLDLDIDTPLFGDVDSYLKSSTNETEKKDDKQDYEKQKNDSLKTETKNKESESAKNLFRPNVISFDTKKRETKEQKEETTKPKFTTSFSSDDPEEIIKHLKENRAEYDRLQVEKKIMDEQSDNSLEGSVIDLSTGSMKSGSIDAKEATDKINRVADSLIQTSRKDKLLDMQLNSESSSNGFTYKIQTESDYERNIQNFVLDIYKVEIRIFDDEENFIRKDIAKLIVAPIAIPESGTKLVTDICAYLESNGESHGAVVLPGGKTTIAIRCEDYSVFVRGAWEHGEFVSSVSVLGSGNKVEHELVKKEVRPTTMERMGIGHNLLILDHATTVHIIPLAFKNTNYDYTSFMGVVIKDYGIDQDAECLISGDQSSILVRGEKLKYNINCSWDEKKNLVIDQRVIK